MEADLHAYHQLTPEDIARLCYRRFCNLRHGLLFRPGSAWKAWVTAQLAEQRGGEADDVQAPPGVEVLQTEDQVQAHLAAFMGGGGK